MHVSRIRLSPAASMISSADGVILRSDLGTFRLRGKDMAVFASSIAPLLDGTRDVNDIASALADYDPDSVKALCHLLDQRGLLEHVRADVRADTPGDAPVWRESQDRFVRAMGLDPDEVTGQLAAAHVVIVGLEPWGASAAIDLARSGVGSLTILDDRLLGPDDLLASTQWTPAQLGQRRTVALRSVLAALAPACEVSIRELTGEALLPPAGDLTMVLTALTVDDHFVLRQLAVETEARGIRTLHGHLDGFEAWIGPLVVPGESACWDCFRLRRLAVATAPQPAHELDAKLITERAEPRARAMLAPMAPLAGHMLAMETLKILALGVESKLAGCVRVLDLVTGEASQHRVVPMPWCQICGGAAARLGASTEIPDPSAGATFEHVHNSEQVRRVLDGFVDDKLGIVHDLKPGDETDGWTLPHTASVVTSNYTDGHFVSWAPLNQSGAGKSLSRVGAEIGAVGEAIERYSASRYRYEDLHRARLADLDGDVLDPRTLCLYDDAQYDACGFEHARFDPDRPLHWTRGTWFGTDEPVWIPALVAYFNFSPPAGEHFCQVSSNGLAAGGDRRDAALRAVFELIERDALMLTWLCQLPARAIALDDTLEPALLEVVRVVERRGLDIELFSLDVGAGIPTVLALGLGDGHKTPATIVSLACHADARVAARKAILEQAHVGPYLDHMMAHARVPEAPEQVRQLDEHAAYYFPRERRSAFDFLRSDKRRPLHYAELSELCPPAGADIYDYTAQRLSNAGLRVAIADTTSPDVALSPFRVARAIGEHVQPIHFGYHRRRLNNPRLQARLAGRAVNPDPHPLA